MRPFLSPLLASLLVLATTLPGHAADPTIDELRAMMKKVGEESIAGKVDAAVATVHPSLIAAIGGEEKAKEILPKLMRAEFDQLTQAGLKLTSFETGDPVEIRKSGEWTFVIVPTTLRAESDKGRFTMKSYTLATCKTGDTGWKLLRLGLPEEKVRQLVPELPADMAIPAKGKPQFEPK